ncbi:MAG: hypothetical protein ACI4K7_10155 [Oscillospiraceae bacterium]
MVPTKRGIIKVRGDIPKRMPTPVREWPFIGAHVFYAGSTPAAAKTAPVV